MNTTATDVPVVDEGTLHPTIFFLMWFNVLLTSGGNLITIIAFLSNQEIRNKPGNIYILNLALADTKVGIISLPFFNLWWHFGTWVFGEWACKCWLVVDYTAVTQSMIAIILISWDRLWMVSHINTYRNKQTTYLAGIIICTTWAFWYVYYILLVIFGDRAVEGYEINYTNDCDMHINYLLNYTIYEIVGLFIIPLLIVAYLNFKIYIHVKRRLLKSKSTNMSQKNHKAAVTLAILVATYLVCWTPYHIILVMETIGVHVPGQVLAVVEYLLWLNSAVNPFVYVCTNPLFRQQLRKMFCCKGSVPVKDQSSRAQNDLAVISSDR